MPSITRADACPRSRLLPRSLTAMTAAGVLALGIFPGAASAAALHAGHHPRPALAQAPAVTAYTYANKPQSKSYTPEKDYSYNSTGDGIGITRAGTGKYTVTFYGLGSEAGHGTVDVTPEGFDAALCSVTHWAQDSTGANLQVGVDCWALSGAALNDYFEVAFTSGGSAGGTNGYVFANNATATSYTPSPAYQFNSSGGTNKIKRTGVGVYQVSLPGTVVVDGTVKVTAYGTNADACETAGWVAESPGQVVDVDCFSKSGAAANDKFTMTFAASSDLLGDGGPSGYLWANEPTASSYVPAALYQYDTDGTQATVTNLGETGEWENSWAGESQGDAGDQQATAYGSDDSHCVIDGPVGVNGAENGDVYCFDNSGNPIDDYYTTQWLVK